MPAYVYLVGLAAVEQQHSCDEDHERTASARTAEALATRGDSRVCLCECVFRVIVLATGGASSLAVYNPFTTSSSGSLQIKSNGCSGSPGGGLSHTSHIWSRSG